MNDMNSAINTVPKNSDQKFCHACARVLHVSAGICLNCGAHQPVAKQSIDTVGLLTPAALQRTTADQKHCYGCGQIVHISAPACPKCGARQSGASLSRNEANLTEKSRVTAAVLAFLLGGIGGHKFYCGKVGLGFVYLIFFWTWIPALIALVEGIIYLTNSSSDEEFTQKYCI